LKVNGNIKNIKKYIIDQLEAVYDMQVPIGQISTNEINEQIVAVTDLLEREVAVYINRQGKVVQVSVGDTATVDLPQIKERTSELRLSGIRCIHTHPSADTTLSDPDLSSLRRLRFDVMVALARKGTDIIASMAFFTGEYENDLPELQGVGPVEASVLHKINLTYLTTVVNKKLSRDTMKTTFDEEERAVLAGIELSGKRSTGWTVEDSLEELRQLAETAGAVVVGKLTQKKDRPDPALFLGKGKIQEISLLIQETNANLIIMDDELSPAQQRNLEQFLGIKVLDRTALILDIFTQRARSSEGKLQVELAQLRYTLPRIGGQGLILSRLGGGIGTRGPGETKLEVDRRRIYTKIHDIEKQIAQLKKHRTPAPREPQGFTDPNGRIGGVYQCGKINAAQCLDRCRRICGRQAFCHTGSNDAAGNSAEQSKNTLDGYRRLHSKTATSSCFCFSCDARRGSGSRSFAACH